MENRKKIKIGFCPTMTKYAKKIVAENDFQPIPFSGAAEALYFLKGDQIDIALIGRKAGKKEFNGFEKKLKDGYTLINQQRKQMIPKDFLPKIEIHTYLSPEIVRKKFPELKLIHFHKELSESLVGGEIILIDWKDWRDNFFLLIPVENNHQKVEKYRTPFLYSKNNSLINKNYLI